VQLQLSFVEEEIDSEPTAVWSTLDGKHRSEAVATLARLIIKLAAAGVGREDNDE
jgi:hypothetical protein